MTRLSPFYNAKTLRRTIPRYLLADSCLAHTLQAQICASSHLRVDAVFVGRVLKLDRGTNQPSVDRSFKGVSGSQIEVLDMPGCSPRLKLEGTYVVLNTAHLHFLVLSGTESAADRAEFTRLAIRLNWNLSSIRALTSFIS